MQRQLFNAVLKINRRLATLRSRAHWPQQWGRGRKLLAITALALCLSVPSLAVVNDVFSDVPAAAFYHDAVNAIYRAGITAGCAAGLYCPDQSVTRAQMAVFLHRGLGRVAYGNGDYAARDATFSDVAMLTINTGGVAGQTGFVKVDAAITAYNANTAGCPCVVEYQIVRDGGGTPFVHSITLGNDVGGVDSNGSGGATLSVAVPTATTQTFRLQARVSTVSGAGSAISAGGTITAVYAPFGGTGTNTLALQPSNADELPRESAPDTKPEAKLE
jgi:hypothetical protein